MFSSNSGTANTVAAGGDMVLVVPGWPRCQEIVLGNSEAVACLPYVIEVFFIDLVWFICSVCGCERASPHQIPVCM